MRKLMCLSAALFLFGTSPVFASNCHSGAGGKKRAREGAAASGVPSTGKERSGHGLRKKSEAFTEKVYVCPKHLDVKYDKPGECPKSGLPLEEKKVLMTYACPDKDCEHVSREEGVCPESGEKMIKTEALKEIKIKAIK